MLLIHRDAHSVQFPGIRGASLRGVIGEEVDLIAEPPQGCDGLYRTGKWLLPSVDHSVEVKDEGSKSQLIPPFLIAC